jgi:hypothetical protein
VMNQVRIHHERRQHVRGAESIEAYQCGNTYNDVGSVQAEITLCRKHKQFSLPQAISRRPDFSIPDNR